MRLVIISLLSLLGLLNQALFACPPAAEEEEGVATGATKVGRPGVILRLMTYNIHHGEGMDGKFDLERLAQVITDRRPDLVAVQEVDVETRRASGVDQAAELARLTGMHYAFGKFMDFDGGEYGQMVLSKFPILEMRNLPLPPGPEPRTALVVEVEVEIEAEAEAEAEAPTRSAGGRLLFVGNHFYASEDERGAQASRLSELLADEIAGGVPIILAGDFNSTPGSKPMAILGEHWVDPTLAKNRYTWPSERPRVEIDHILYSPAQRFKFVKSKVPVEKIASDHRPVFTVLELVGSGEE